MAKITSKFRQFLSPAKFISFFQSDIKEELLKKVNNHLLVLDDKLVNLSDQTSELLADHSAVEIARAANKLLDNPKQVSIALFLPATEFAYTAYELAGVSSDNVGAALSYQETELFPAANKDLLLAVSHVEGESNTALWFDKQRAEDLWLELNQFNISLAVVFPRIFAAVDTKRTEQAFREECANYQLVCHLNNDSLQDWQLVWLDDLDDDNFAKQWDKSLKRLNPLDTKVMYADERWTHENKTGSLQLASSAYGFYPDLAKQSIQKQSRLKSGRFGTVLVVLALILAAVPFVGNQMSYMKAEERYQVYKEKSADVRQMKGYALSTQEVWAPFFDHPEPDLVHVITVLDNVIPKDSWLQSFNYKEGNVEIEGFSPNPTQLLQILSKQKEFENVAFSQRIQAQGGRKNERFGITFNIKGSNLDEYKDIYFPDN